MWVIPMRLFAFIAPLFVASALLGEESPFSPEEKARAQKAESINNEAVQLYERGKPIEAIAKLRQAFAMRQELYSATRFPNGHLELATSFNNLGVVLQAIGSAEEALAFFRQGLEMNQKLFPAAKHPDGQYDVANSLNNMGGVLQALGRLEEALPYFRQAHEMKEKLHPVARFPNGSPELGLSFHNLASLYQAMGQSDQALPLFRKAIDMMQKLFPNGHPNLASSLNTMAVALHSLGRKEQALEHFQQGLEMRRKLFPESKFPRGHPHVATSLNNMGYVLDSLGRTEDALPYFQEGLAMRQKLLPPLHPEIFQSLNNVGYALQSTGRGEESIPYYRNSLEIAQQVFPVERFPVGHPSLALSLSNMGGILEATGSNEPALDFYRQSVRMQQRWLRRELETSSEEAAFDKLAGELPFINTYLSLTLRLKSSADEAYAVVWPGRSMVTRLLEQRQADRRAAHTDAGPKLERLRELRRQIDQLLQTLRIPADERDRRLSAASEDKDRLERELVALMPSLKRREERDRLGPKDLGARLPDGVALIDIVRFMRLEYVDGRKRKGAPCYSAFVLIRNRPIQRIDFANADEIDSAVRDWRSAIDSRRSEAEAANVLRRLVWEPLSRTLPEAVSTLYLSADGDLARVPWAAIPIDDKRIVLERFSVAVVPHGNVLFDIEESGETTKGEDSILTLGDIDYGKSGWPDLPGTKVELSAITGVAGSKSISASRDAASVAGLSRLVSKVNYVHLATHAEFKAEELALERKRANQAHESQSPGFQPRAIAAKNPLGYVGLVLSNGELLSGLGIVDLKLDHLKLVTLSACETGLGELTGGEGVHGLVRAFHLAGARNVVASLWKVSDAATATLMAKFYHEMWVNKKPPITALREAQLFVFYNPDKISDVLGERGAPKRTEALALRASVEPFGPRAKTSPTKHWAAFVLSGVGK